MDSDLEASATSDIVTLARHAPGVAPLQAGERRNICCTDDWMEIAEVPHPEALRASNDGSGGRRSSPIGNAVETRGGEADQVITKRKRLGKVQVTFVQPSADEPVYVAGTFNDWTAELLKPAKDGTLRATVSAAPGEVLEFRYVTASGHWFDDEQVDELVGNDQGTVNGLFRV